MPEMLFNRRIPLTGVRGIFFFQQSIFVSPSGKGSYPGSGGAASSLLMRGSSVSESGEEAEKVGETENVKPVDSGRSSGSSLSYEYLKGSGCSIIQIKTHIK